MSINDKIRMVMTSAKVSGRQLSEAFGTSQGTAAMKVSRGIKSISDLVTICDYCGATLTITTKDGTVIPLTLADVEDEKQAKNKDK